MSSFPQIGWNIPELQLHSELQADIKSIFSAVDEEYGSVTPAKAENTKKNQSILFLCIFLHYTQRITPKRVTGSRFSSPSHSIKTIQLYLLKF